MSFIQHMGRSFGTQMVVVIHPEANGGELRHEVEAQVQPKKAFFDADAPVFEGDRIELTDPRGGSRVVWITDVDVHQAGGHMSSFMSHIEATFVERDPDLRQPSPSQIIHGDTIIISGDHVNVATRGGSVKQQVPVSAGYEDLALAVKKALELIDSDDSIDAKEKMAAGEASTVILDELVSDAPDHAKLKGLLTTLRGVLVAGTNAAASAFASGLVHQLLVPSH